MLAVKYVDAWSVMANFKDVKIRKCEMKLFGCDENVGR
jgi:hypothetical protein